MRNQLVDIVLTDNIVSLARIVEDMGPTIQVQLLTKNHGGIYIFNEEVEDVPKESVSGYYDTDDLEKTGLFVRTRFGYEEISESDSDYDPSDEEGSCGSISLSDEEFDEDEEDE